MPLSNPETEKAFLASLVLDNSIIDSCIASMPDRAVASPQALLSTVSNCRALMNPLLKPHREGRAIAIHQAPVDYWGHRTFIGSVNASMTGVDAVKLTAEISRSGN